MSATSSPPLPTPGYQHAQTLIGHKKAISSVRFSPDGSMLASSSNDRTVRIWNVEDGYCTQTLIGHALGISDVAWHPDSTMLATASDDTNVCLWSQSGRQKRVMRGHTNYVMCCNFHPDGHTLATGSFDNSVRLWDVEKGASIRKIAAHSDVVVSAHFNNDGSKLVTAGFDGCARVWDTKSGKNIYDFTVTSQSLCFGKWSPNAKYLLVGSFDETWKLVDATDGDIVRTYEGHQFNDYCIFASFSLTGRKSIISGSADNTVCIWDINSRQLVQKLRGHKDVVVAVAAHPSENIIASGALDEDKTVRLWKIPEESEESDDYSSLNT